VYQVFWDTSRSDELCGSARCAGRPKRARRYRDDLLAGRLEIAVAQRGLMCGAESDRSSPDTVLVRQKEVWA
jgi:hypothetical protein